MKKLLLLMAAALLVTGAYAKNKPLTAKMNTPVAVKGMEMKVTDRMSDLVADAADVSLWTPTVSAGEQLPPITFDEGTPTKRPGTYYARPRGTFFTGLSLDGYGYSNWNYFLFTPPFYDVTVTDCTTEFPSWRTWQGYGPFENGEYPALEPVDDVTTYTIENIQPFYRKAPELTSYNAMGDSTFAWGYFKAGGTANYTNASSGRTYLASNNDRSWGSLSYNPTQTMVNNATTNQNAAKRWSYDTVEVKGIGEFLNVEPGHPFVLHGVYPRLRISKGGSITLEVLRCTQKDDGTMNTWSSKVLATKTVEVTAIDGKAQMISFDELVQVDPETGEETALVIDEPVMILLKSDDAEYCALFGKHENLIPGEAHAYLYFMAEEKARMGGANFHYTTGYATAWDFMYDLTYTYLVCDEDEFVAPVEGGEKTFTFNSYYNSYSWEITGENNSDIPEWVSVEVEDVMDGNSYTGETNALIQVEPLPDGETYRETKLDFHYAGASHIVTVKQGSEDTPPTPGDVNGDGIVSGADVTALYGLLLDGKEVAGNADVNGDGSVSGADVTALYNLLLK
jgi:hypothetical protein